MQFKKFTIQNYRGITSPIELSLERHEFLPLVGLNDVGKTTVLNALVAFHPDNDSLNNGAHLRNTNSISSSCQNVSPIISATLSVGRDQEARAIAYNLNPLLPQQTFTEITISRDLASEKFSISADGDLKLPDTHSTALNLFKYFVPEIRYVDDSAGAIPDVFTFRSDSKESTAFWPNLVRSVFEFINGDSIDDLITKSAPEQTKQIDYVNLVLKQFLNGVSADIRWLGNTAFELEFAQIVNEPSQQDEDQLNLQLLVTDPTANGSKIPLSYRGRGFIWRVSIALNLIFGIQPVLERGNYYQRPPIFLFDEPASYLHPAAQMDWCTSLPKLRRYANNVIYTTHSHYLLNPGVIPPRSIHIVSRDEASSIRVSEYYNHPFSRQTRYHAFEPIQRALEIEPYALALQPNQRVLIVEGIFDYYCYQLLANLTDVAILPSTSADNIQKHVSYLLAARFDFVAMWDHDEGGMNALDRATQEFGEALANRRFTLLPRFDNSPANNWALESMFEESDLSLIKQRCALNSNANFKRTIEGLYYHPLRDQIVRDISPSTVNRFEILRTQINDMFAKNT